MVKSSAPRRDPVVKNTLYVAGALILAGLAFNVLGGMGLINGVAGSGYGAPAFQVTGNIQARVDSPAPGKKVDVEDLSGTVTNNTGRACTSTEVIGTLLDQGGAVVTITSAASLATSAGQTASWNKSIPIVAQANPITHATWAAVCGDAH
jgi:hypothetical protein